jgi:imidazoleglycerol-phosphate dehydratase/histidinol-phosphatase
MRPVLFIDRDGTINHETADEQIDHIDKVTYLKDVFYYLKKVQAESDFVLAMVTNQDGLGTDSFPEDTFWPVHNLILRTLESQGINF